MLLSTSASGPTAGSASYKIDNSIILNDNDSAYLSRTLSVAGNRKTFTISNWVKRTDESDAYLFDCFVDSSNLFYVSFRSGNEIIVITRQGSTTSRTLRTTAVYRDMAAHMHILVVVDSTEAAAADRFKLFVNGEQVTDLSQSTYLNIPLNSDFVVNGTTQHNIGRYGGSATYSDYYLAEPIFVDGQALTPSDFGKTDETTGQWVPKAYTGTYGTNGFFLDFKDETSTTTLGYDVSGNANHWTLNNMAVSDQTIDTPTNNFCTLNPIANTFNGTISDGDLKFVATSTIKEVVHGTQNIPLTGKYYFEARPTTNVGSWTAGVAPYSTDDYAGQSAGVVVQDSVIRSGGVITQSSLTTFVSGDTLGVAIDADANTVQFYKNGVAHGTSESYAGYFLPVAGNYVSGQDYIFDFGQKGFTYTPPTGFLALSTANLPDPVIKKPSNYFNPVLYTGNGAQIRSISGVGFRPNLSWHKDMSGTSQHQLYDSTRGYGSGKMLNSANAAVEGSDGSGNSDSQYGFLTDAADGFDLDDGTIATTGGWVNTSGRQYVVWNWLESVTAGFDIVSYVGDGIAGKTVAHSLGAKPDIVFVKNLDSATNWLAYSTTLGSTKLLLLNGTNAEITSSIVWNNTEPDSSNFTLGTDISGNENTKNHIAYLFTEIEGYSKFSVYTGNGSTDGPLINCGFRPAYVVIKRTDSAGSWLLVDATRDPYNQADAYLLADSTQAEMTTGTIILDMISNGFKIRATGSSINASGGTYIYMAFAEAPMKYANAR